jgi:HAD superfamily hydrolase (TIGR01450 family)
VVAGAPWPPEPGGTWVLDLDGVVWLTGEPIGDAPRAIERLHGAGVRTLYVTNNSAPTLAELVERLERAGVEAAAEDLVTSAQAAANLVPPGSRVLVLADGGALEALADKDITVVEEGPADVVLVGWTHRFDFDRLAIAATAVRGGARLVGTNEDPTHPTPHGLMPGAGALLAAVVTASGTTAMVAGKPHRPMADLVTARHTELRVVVGDRPSTDGVFAGALGIPFALVLSGVTPPGGPPPDPVPVVSAADLGALVDSVLGTG